MLERLLEILSQGGFLSFWGPFLILVSCGIGVPIPEDIVLVVGGYLAHEFRHQLLSVMIVLYLGILIGDSIVFSAGRFVGGKALKTKRIKRFFTDERRLRVEGLFKKFGSSVVFVARFLPGLRAPVFFFCGAIRYSFTRFIFLDGLAALLSAPLFVWLGFFAAKKYGADLTKLTHHMGTAKYVILGLAFIGAMTVVLAIKKKIQGTSLSMWFLLLSFSFASVVSAKTIRVLTYGSMAREGSFGKTLEKSLESRKSDLKIKWITTEENSGLLGRLKADQKRFKKLPYDVVFGLEDVHFNSAAKLGLVQSGHVFNRSPFVFLANTQIFPKAQWPKSWSEVPQKLSGKVLIQDPRTSGLGVSWLKVIFEKKILSLEDSKKVTFARFPTWSASYAAFLKGISPVIWTFATSEFYHRCHDRVTQYQSIPLMEGYPEHVEWIALTNNGDNKASATEFVDFVLSPEVQKLVPLENWMLPALKNQELPECFRGVLRQTWENSNVSDSKLSEWIDLWTL